MQRSVSTYPAGTLTVNDASGALPSAAAYVLISHGPDGSLAYSSETGTVRADRHTSATQNENTTTNNDTTYNLRPNNTVDGGNYFDDIVAYKTAPNIIQACGAGSCGNPN